MANVRAGPFDAIKLGRGWSAQRTDLVTPRMVVLTHGGREREPAMPVARRAHPHGRIAKARAGKPKPFSTLGQVTTIIAPVAGTLSRLAITSIW